MLTVEYDPDSGEAVYDADVEAKVEKLIRWTNGDVTMVYATENVFAGVRCAIAEGRMNYAAVQFKFGDLVFQANRFGAINPWPRGFCDQTIDYSVRIAKAATKKYRAEQESKKGA